MKHFFNRTTIYIFAILLITIIFSAFMSFFAPKSNAGSSNNSSENNTYSSNNSAINSSEISIIDDVTIGYVPQESIALEADDGYLYGIDAEYVYKIAQYAQFNPIFVSFDNYEDLLSVLEKGDIDMAVGISKRGDREERFLFASNYFLQGTVNLCVSNSNSFNYSDPDAFSRLKIGIGKGSVYESIFRDWLDENNIDATVIIYDNEPQIMDDIKNGTIDGTLLSGSQSKGFNNVIAITNTPYYPVFNKSNFVLKNRVDNAITRIIYENPAYPQLLDEKYSIITNGEVIFTDEEKNYISEKKTLNVAVINDDKPYYYKNENEESGIIVDMFKKIEEYTGFDCNFVAFKSMDEACNAVTNGKADIVGIVHFSPICADKKGLSITGDLETINIMKISITGNNNNQKYAVTAADIDNYEELLAAKNISLDLVECTNLEDAFDKLNDGVVDNILCCSSQANYLINNYRFEKYSSTSFYGLTFEVSSAVAKGNKNLSTIMSKINSVNDDEIIAIISSNTSADDGFLTIIHKASMKVIIGLFALILVFITTILSLIFIYQNQRNLIKLARSRADTQAAQKTNAAISNFMSSLSHDMRTPLNGIIGFANLAIDTPDENTKQEYLKKISSTSNLMLDLINDVLDISKIESGKLEFTSKVFNASNVADTILTTINVIADQKNIEFKANINHRKDLYVIGDPLRIGQLLINLLSNAIKYTPSGGHVTWTMNIDEDGNIAKVHTTIADDGIGMSKDFQAHMYESFSQEMQASYTNVQGTGLGLYIVKQIIGLLNGTIDVDSDLGKGTKYDIKFDLPIADISDIIPEETTDTRTLSDILDGKNILLVEDNEINAEIAKINLENANCKAIDLAVNGKDAVDMFEKSTPFFYDLIIMDIRMPIMNGYEATKIIREMDREDAKKVIIIAMTADSFDADVKKSLNTGMNAHVSKPIKIDVLTNTLRKLF